MQIKVLCARRLRVVIRVSEQPELITPGDTGGFLDVVVPYVNVCINFRLPS